jgi:hypothetical protein
MMIAKIIAGLHTGAERAALDTAVKLGIAHGGHAPGIRLASDQFNYQINYLPGQSDFTCLEKNIVASEGSLIVTRGNLTGRSLWARNVAERHDCRWLHVDLSQTPTVQGAAIISSWLRLHDITTLHITGTDAAKDPSVYADTMRLLESAFFVKFFKDTVDRFLTRLNHIERLTETLIQEFLDGLNLKNKVILANLDPDDIKGLDHALSLYLEVRMGELSVPEQVYRGLLEGLWQSLQMTHKLRVVK